MPLPFSFSTQRQSSEVERPVEADASAVSEVVMSHAPGHVSTEPLLAALGGGFLPPPAFEVSPRGVPPQPWQAPVPVSPVRPPHQHFAEEPKAAPVVDSQAATLQIPPPVPMQPASKDGAAGQDWTAQIEQLRNDIFGIAMNVSALNDRLDRMEQRLPQAGQSMQAGVAALRGEIESWLANHLGAAVEHCMHQIMSRTNSAPTCPVN